MEILEQRRATIAGPERIVGRTDAQTFVGCQCLAVGDDSCTSRSAVLVLTGMAIGASPVFTGRDLERGAPEVREAAGLVMKVSPDVRCSGIVVGADRPGSANQPRATCVQWMTIRL